MKTTIKIWLYGTVFFVGFGAAGLLNAAARGDTRSTSNSSQKVHPALVQVEDVPGLPRVLLIGDSVSMQYTLEVRKLLEGVANVHRPACNCHSTLQVLDEVDSYLGDGPWDVIHFNCGIHDVTHLGENRKATAPPAGKIRVPLETYKKNLQAIIARLKRTNAKLVWASTTPIGKEYEKERGYRLNRDVVKYNEAAAEIMKREGIAIDDLYSLIIPRREELQKDGVHYTPEGASVLARQVAESIKKELPVKRAK